MAKQSPATFRIDFQNALLGEFEYQVVGHGDIRSLTATTETLHNLQGKAIQGRVRRANDFRTLDLTAWTDDEFDADFDGAAFGNPLFSRELLEFGTR